MVNHWLAHTNCLMNREYWILNYSQNMILFAQNVAILRLAVKFSDTFYSKTFETHTVPRLLSHNRSKTRRHLQ